MSTINVPQGFRPLREILHKLRKAGEGDFTLVCEGKGMEGAQLSADGLFGCFVSDGDVGEVCCRAELQEVEADHVECMVNFFYHGDFEDWVPGQDVLEVQLGVAALGEMYHIPSLETCAAEIRYQMKECSFHSMDEGDSHDSSSDLSHDM
ncbi:Hypothetical predicted protein [Lecanosticta acicola]|uniref:Uncharacterized protein n=1 Tax=Lecanosticta acicola TaxID=111012 RepID=A0AAI8Z7F4_9PEZI|nr:Hypothetical predicted protein [Lecanosticta acicola]